MNKFKQILTREQLENEIYDLLRKHFHSLPNERMFGSKGFVNELLDLIADLPNLCFHSKRSDII